jgi:hypothetical protein
VAGLESREPLGTALRHLDPDVEHRGADGNAVGRIKDSGETPGEIAPDTRTAS